MVLERERFTDEERRSKIMNKDRPHYWATATGRKEMDRLPGTLVAAAFARGTGDEVMIRRLDCKCVNRIHYSAGHYRVYVNGECVSDPIYTPKGAYEVAEQHGYERGEAERLSD